MRGRIMGKVSGNWITGAHSGRACRRDDIYTKVKKDQGTVPDSCLSCEFSILWEGIKFIKCACGEPCFRLLRMILLIRSRFKL